MNQKTFSRITGIVFLLIAVLHILRMAYGWDAAIAGWSVPLWLSAVALAMSLYLAYHGLTLGRKR